LPIDYSKLNREKLEEKYQATVQKITDSHKLILDVSKHAKRPDINIEGMRVRMASMMKEHLGLHAELTKIVEILYPEIQSSEIEDDI